MLCCCLTSHIHQSKRLSLGQPSLAHNVPSRSISHLFRQGNIVPGTRVLCPRSIRLIALGSFETEVVCSTCQGLVQFPLATAEGMLYVKVSAGRSRWGPSPGSSGHTAYHEKDHLLDVSRTQSRYHRSSDQGEVVLGV